MENLESEFVLYPLALRMKVLGYEDPCLAGYELDIVNDGKPELIFPNVIKQFDEEDEIFEDSITIYPRLFTIKNDVVLAPTWQSAFKWFRNNHRLSILIYDCLDDYICEVVEWTLTEDKITHKIPNRIKTYEECEIVCLEKLIEIVEQKIKLK